MCQPATTKSFMIIGFWLLNANLLLITNKKMPKKFMKHLHSLKT